MTYSHPLVLLLCVLVGGLIIIGIFGAVMTAFDARKGTKTPPMNPDDNFWKENGDTWLS